LKTTHKQRGGVTGKGFMPGQSGNPGGRPKSMAETILEQRPTTSADLVELWTTVAFGSAAVVQRKYGVKPRLQDRLAAAAQLADRLHGRPTPTLELEPEPPAPGPLFIFPPGTHIDVHDETLGLAGQSK
jgi:hypothetical protein